MRNLRKLKVNADVTCAVWMLEWVGNIFVMTLWSIGAFQGVDDRSLFLEGVIVVYVIVLPHCYLMNTAHNKDRVVDEGLMNIIRNALHVPFDLTIFNNLFCDRLRENRIAVDGEVVAEDTETSKKRTDVSTITQTDEQINAAKTDIAIILENGSSMSKNETNLEDPSTSAGVYETVGGNSFMRASMTDSEEESINQAEENDHSFSVKKQLLDYMKVNVNSEEHYIHYFLQLIDYESKFKDKSYKENKYAMISIEQDEEFQDKKALTVKSRNSNNSKLKSKTSHDRCGQNQFLSSRAALLSAEKKFELALNRLRRLEDIEEHCNNGEKFKKFLNDLIDFEEGLIEN